MMRGSKGKRFYLINEDLDKVPFFPNELGHFAFPDILYRNEFDMVAT
jgi:hypothetical protein